MLITSITISYARKIANYLSVTLNNGVYEHGNAKNIPRIRNIMVDTGGRKIIAFFGGDDANDTTSIPFISTLRYNIEICSKSSVVRTLIDLPIVRRNYLPTIIEKAIVN